MDVETQFDEELDLDGQDDVEEEKGQKVAALGADDEETEPAPIIDIGPLCAPRPLAMFRTKEDPQGKPYEIRTPDDFGVAEDQRIRAELREYAQLSASDKLNGEDRKRLVARLNNIFGKLLIAPAEVKAQVNDRQKAAVITVFTTALFGGDATALERGLIAHRAREGEPLITAS